MNIFFKKNNSKSFKSVFLYVLDDSEMIWEKNIFSIFRTKFFDFGSIWRLHRMFNRYILLVVLSLPIDEQLCQRILSLHYWFGCSDSPKLPITSKNVVFAIWSHFWAWPLRATFWISIFKLSYLLCYFVKIRRSSTGSSDLPTALAVSCLLCFHTIPV